MSDPSEPQLDSMAPAQLREFAQRERQRAEEAAAQANEAEDLRRENALLKAGVDLDSSLGKLFASGYKGDLTVEAVSSAWSEVAPAAPVAPEPTPPAAEEPPAEPTAEELAVAQGRSALTTGSAPPGEEPQAPANEAMLAAFHDARAKGRPTLDAQRAGLQVLMNRAMDDDPSAIYQRPGESPQAAKQRWDARFG